MPSPYSYDLRQKVIKAIDGGMSKTQVSPDTISSNSFFNLRKSGFKGFNIFIYRLI